MALHAVVVVCLLLVVLTLLADSVRALCSDQNSMGCDACLGESGSCWFCEGSQTCVFNSLRGPTPCPTEYTQTCPTPMPTATPQPTKEPTPMPTTTEPTPKPTGEPTPQPTKEPTPQPTKAAVCGDNFIEQAEECDGPAGSFPQCCDPVTCKFRPTTYECNLGANLDKCEERARCNGAGSCSATTPSPTSRRCYSSQGRCDKNVNCNGSSKACPSDSNDDEWRAGEKCYSAANVCQTDTFCQVGNIACPATQPTATSATSTLYLAQSGPCDVADYCIVGSIDPPPDEKRPDGFVCAPADAKPSGQDFNCDLPDECNGVSKQCIAKFQPSSFTCRTAISAAESGADAGKSCDLDDKCSGDQSAQCVVRRRQSSYVCREAKGPCDVDDTCSGDTNFCRTDVKQPLGHVCRALASGGNGLCDIREECDGVSDSCPADVVRSNGVSCRPRGTNKQAICDKEEFCDGSSPHCPFDDVYKSFDEVQCRQKNGICDVAENCSGLTSGACPPDVFLGPETVCRPSRGFEACDNPEVCPGDSTLCPANVDQRNSPCNDGNICTGVETGSTVDACGISVDDGITAICTGRLQCDCRVNADCDDNNACTIDRCVNPADSTQLWTAPTAGGRCNNELPAPAGTICRQERTLENGAGCDEAEVCDGTSVSCPADGFKAFNVTCRPSAGDCDVAELCSGASSVCPQDEFLPSSTVCRASAGDCDLDEFCFGNSAECPTDAKQPPTLVCRPAATNCDLEELCDGVNNDCPDNRLIDDGFGCDDGNNCTFPDTCVLGVCSAPYQCPCFDDSPCASVTNPCARSFCDPLANRCVVEPREAGTPCDDRMDCTLRSACAGSDTVCVPERTCPGVVSVGSEATVEQQPCNGHGVCCRDECTCDETYTGASCKFPKNPTTGERVCPSCRRYVFVIAGDDEAAFNGDVDALNAANERIPSGVRIDTMTLRSFEVTVGAAGFADKLLRVDGESFGVAPTALVSATDAGIIVHFSGEPVYLVDIELDVSGVGGAAVVKTRTYINGASPPLPYADTAAAGARTSDVEDATASSALNKYYLELVGVSAPNATSAYAKDDSVFGTAPLTSLFNADVQFVTGSTLARNGVTELVEFEKAPVDAVLIAVAPQSPSGTTLNIRSLTIIPVNEPEQPQPQAIKNDTDEGAGVAVVIVIIVVLCLALSAGAVFVFKRRPDVVASLKSRATPRMSSTRRRSSTVDTANDAALIDMKGPQRRHSRAHTPGPSAPTLPLMNTSATQSSEMMTYGSVAGLSRPSDTMSSSSPGVVYSSLSDVDAAAAASTSSSTGRRSKRSSRKYGVVPPSTAPVYDHAPASQQQRQSTVSYGSLAPAPAVNYGTLAPSPANGGNSYASTAGTRGSEYSSPPQSTAGSEVSYTQLPPNGGGVGGGRGRGGGGGGGGGRGTLPMPPMRGGRGGGGGGTMTMGGGGMRGGRGGGAPPMPPRRN